MPATVQEVLVSIKGDGEVGNENGLHRCNPFVYWRLCGNYIRRLAADCLSLPAAREWVRALLGGGAMHKSTQVLAACPPFALPALQRILGGYTKLVPATSLDEARRILESNTAIAMIVCGVHFDESRMYELLEYARQAYPQVPFVCVRVLNTELPKISREALRIAAESSGATAFIDLPALVERSGQEQADSVLRTAVIARLCQRRAASA
jgi:CheY-like chemotaxis protein